MDGVRWVLEYEVPVRLQPVEQTIDRPESDPALAGDRLSRRPSVIAVVVGEVSKFEQHEFSRAADALILPHGGRDKDRQSKRLPWWVEGDLGKTPGHPCATGSGGETELHPRLTTIYVTGYGFRPHLTTPTLGPHLQLVREQPSSK